MIVFCSILAMEYFDETLKNADKAAKIIGLKTIGVFPKIYIQTGSLNFPFVTNRLLEIAIQQIELLTQLKSGEKEPRTILFFSSLNTEGKTVTAGNIAWKLKKQGKSVLYLNFSRESLRLAESSQIGYPANPPATQGFSKPARRFRFINKLFGYHDTMVDPFSPFLQHPEHYLDSDEYLQFQIDPEYYSVETFRDLLENSGLSSGISPDFVIIEIPAVLYYSFPPKLIANAHLAVLVCRANRVWSPADHGAIETLKTISSQEPVVLVNGVEMQAIETILGDLPKKRSRLRRIAKNLVRLQFFARQIP